VKASKPGRPGRLAAAGVAVVAVGVLLGAGACRPAAHWGGRTVAVEKRDLVVDVEVTGTLRSVESTTVGPPAQVTDTWEFKIAQLYPEGKSIEAGEVVIAFDTQQLQQKLRDYESEAAAVSEELGKLRAEHRLAVLQDRLDLEDAEAKRRKADLKADKPEDLTARLTLEVSRVERDLAREEVAFREQRDRAKRRQEAASVEVLESRLVRARGRVAEIQAAIAAMAVKASRAGTVIYKENWRGEKKKVGDGMWRGEPVLEIASLQQMAATGQVDEVDGSKVSVGQKVGLRLEAHPEREYPGRVKEVATFTQNESPESRVKVLKLDIDLSQTDEQIMRPGMRFRGRIEVARVPGVVQVPLAAIEATAHGPQVRKRAGSQVVIQPVRLGRRSREAIEVLSGLLPGDEVEVESGPTRSEGAASSLGAS